ncbi:MAG: LuxR C-terminal-related transcriptional regulator [Rhodospirillales bacterium]|nr:LuxR C-terminal-related transcriptional regulator [Rhodospirillales bacterium]
MVQKAVDFDLKARKVRSQQEEILALLDRLTPRERQVLGLIVAGESNKGIAYHLNISDKTVEAHRAKVMEKTEARSLAELMKKVMVLETYQGKP